MADTYFFLDHNGKRQLPTIEELNNYRSEGVTVVFMLDANVCLDIVQFVNYKKQAKADKGPLFHFLEYAQKKNVDVNPMFGLLELCSNHRQLELNTEKFSEMKNKIDFATSYPFKLLRNFQFDYLENYKIFRKLELKSDISSFNSMLLATYTCLLKINSISKNGLSKEKASDNMYKFLDWMLSDIGIILGTELQLALNIFGGEKEVGLAKMIGIGGKPEKVTHSSWGTAWDIFNMRFCCNSFSFSKNVAENTYLIFVTSDVRLGNLISQLHLSSVIDASGFGGITNLYNSYIDLPHFDDEFRGTFSVKIIELLSERFKQKKEIDVLDLKRICQQLEESLVNGN
ncbi:MAG: hypothetical protein SFY32_11350 [Bacteroidota bacterium]|nr:hypothetical protein [Bacteroidota bacterium]